MEAECELDYIEQSMRRYGRIMGFLEIGMFLFCFVQLAAWAGLHVPPPGPAWVIVTALWVIIARRLRYHVNVADRQFFQMLRLNDELLALLERRAQSGRR